MNNNNEFLWAAGILNDVAQDLGFEPDESDQTLTGFALGFNSRKMALRLAKVIAERYAVDVEPIAPLGSRIYWVRINSLTPR